MTRIIGGVLLALGATALAWLWVDGPVSGGTPSTTVEIRMRYSAFEPAGLTVPAGRPITIVLQNDDPIDHEWLVGDDAFHERHRTGTEPVHAERPTEVSVPAGERRATIVTFTGPGEYRFICHLPGHEAYGMAGVLRVVATD